MASDYSKYEEGQKIEFTYYSNMVPRPKCIGIIRHVYGPSMMDLIGKTFWMDVEVIKVVGPDWEKREIEDRTRREDGSRGTIRVGSTWDIKILQ